MGKLSELILNENIEVQVKVIGQNGEPVVAKYVGKDKDDVYPQVIDGMDVPKSNIQSMEVTNTNTDEERGFKGNLTNGEFKKSLAEAILLLTPEQILEESKLVDAIKKKSTRTKSKY